MGKGNPKSGKGAKGGSKPHGSARNKRQDQRNKKFSSDRFSSGDAGTKPIFSLESASTPPYPS